MYEYLLTIYNDACIIHEDSFSTIRTMKTYTVIILCCLSVITANQPVAVQKFGNGNNLFATTVYKEISAKNDGNFLLCPVSAEIILALVQSGAKDETAEEIRNALYLSNSTEEVQDMFKMVLPKLRGNKHYSLRTANKIYVQENYSIKKKFTKIAKNVYRSSVQNIDFSQRDKAANIINEWVEKQTDNKIHNLISPDSLTEHSVAILINALYFKGAWKRGFKQYLTKKADFYKNLQDMVKVETMHRRDYYSYYESPELKAKFLKIPFRGGNHPHMVIVLPNEKDGLGALEDQIDKIFAPSFTETYVNVALPKFKIETTVDFKQILENLGVKKAFTHADFSGIAGEKGEVVISEVLQKSFISVGENGVEAAAATAVHLHAKSLMAFTMEDEVNFIADHPFLFYIKIRNIVVFIGRVTAPM